MKRKETDILNRFYKDCGMELFKLRTEHKLNLIKLSHKTLIPAAKLDLKEANAASLGHCVNLSLSTAN